MCRDEIGGPPIVGERIEPDARGFREQDRLRFDVALPGEAGETRVAALLGRRHVEKEHVKLAGAVEPGRKGGSETVSLDVDGDRGAGRYRTRVQQPVERGRARGRRVVRHDERSVPVAHIRLKPEAARERAPESPFRVHLGGLAPETAMGQELHANARKPAASRSRRSAARLSCMVWWSEAAAFGSACQ